MSESDHHSGMKTTIEIADEVFRKAKIVAAERGQSLKELFSEALEEKLDSLTGSKPPADPPWMQSFGKLRALKAENARIRTEIDTAFGVIEPEDRR